MNVKDFLSKFLQFGIEIEYFKLKKVKNLHGVCCLHSEVEIIDFDQTKERCCAENKTSPQKSCDALKILPESEQIDFIEFKGFKEFIKRNSNSTESQIQERIKNFDLSRKIADSEHILRTVLCKKPSTTNEEHQYYNQTKKNFIIVTDIATDLEEDGIESFMSILDALTKFHQVESILLKCLKDEVDAIPTSALHNIQKSQLKSCRNFDNYCKKWY